MDPRTTLDLPPSDAISSSTVVWFQKRKLDPSRGWILIGKTACVCSYSQVDTPARSRSIDNTKRV